MSEVFPEPIRNLPEADIPLSGIKANNNKACRRTLSTLLRAGGDG